MTPTVETVVVDLTRELSQLMTSGENWQIVLHGGRGADVLMEVKRTRKLVPQRRRQGMQAAKPCSGSVLSVYCELTAPSVPL